MGFLLMAGGNENRGEFDPQIFSFQRVTLAPMTILAGYILVVFALLTKTKKRSERS